MILLRMIAFRPAAVIQPAPAAGDPPAKKPEPPALPVDLRPAATDQTEPSRPPAETLPADKALASDTAAGVAPASAQQPAPHDNTAKQEAHIQETAATQVAEAPDVSTSDHPVAKGAEDAADQATHSELGKPAAVVPQRAESSVAQTRRADALTQDNWPEQFERLTFGGILHNIALNLALQDARDESLSFVIAPQDATLLNDRHHTQLTHALSQQLDQPITATITVFEHDKETPAQRRAAHAAARLAEAERAISSDASLHGLMAAFDGQIIPGSIRPNLAEGAAEADQQEA